MKDFRLISCGQSSFVDGIRYFMAYDANYNLLYWEQDDERMPEGSTPPLEKAPSGLYHPWLNKSIE